MDKQPQVPKNTGGRVRVLDVLRGLSVVSMVLYHGMYDLVYLFGVQAPWYAEWQGYLWQQSICWVFILVSGASLHYGRAPLKRGLTVLGCGLLVSAGTMLFMPEQRIMFGVLHFLGTAMLLGALLRPLLQKIPSAAGALLFFIVFLFGKGVPQGFAGLADVPLIALPKVLYTVPWLFPLGFPSAGFWSSDYFPLVPWLFLFLAGYCAWGMVKNRVRKPETAAERKRGTLIEWIGRHSLVIYVLHQPLLYGLFLLCSKMINK